MADEVSPTMEEVVAEPKEVVKEEMTEEQQLLETLKAASISKPEQLDGTIRNARKTFDMQSERDQLSNQLVDMEKRLAAAETKTPAPDAEEYGQPLDLDTAIAKGVSKVLDQRDAAAAQNQKQMMMSWAVITQDEDFHLVEPIWNEKLKDPNFVYKVQSGQVNPVMEYQNVLRGYYKGIAKSAVSTIETLTKGVVPQTHIESGDARVPNVPVDQEIGENTKQLNKLKEKAETGNLLSEDDEIAAIRAVLSGG
jgi:hypothetical protein